MPSAQFGFGLTLAFGFPENVYGKSLIQNAIITATFAYHAAMRDQPLPRKPLPKPQPATTPGQRPAATPSTTPTSGASGGR